MFKFIESMGITNADYINALLTVGFFVVVAIVVNLFITRVLKNLVKMTKTNLDDNIINILHMPIFFTIILYSIVYSINCLYVQKPYFYYIINIIYTISAFIWTSACIRISSEVVRSSIKKSGSDSPGVSKEIAPLLGNVIKIIFFIACLMVILSIWKIDITPLVASAGIAGIAVAVAAKDTLSNFFGGVSIFFDKPYKIGDFIDIGGNDRGEVVHIGIRSTWIKTRDDIQISVPNSVISSSKIINESAPIPKYRVRIPVGVAYGTDLEKVEKILLTIADENENIHDDPKPCMRFTEFGDSALKVELQCWAENPSLRQLTVHELNMAIYKAFNENGIVIPFPQAEIRLQRGQGFNE